MQHARPQWIEWERKATQARHAFAKAMVDAIHEQIRQSREGERAAARERHAFARVMVDAIHEQVRSARRHRA